MHMPHGFEIYREIPRPDPALVERLRGIPSTDLGDVMYKRGAMDPGIAPLYRPMSPIVGPAVTVSVPDGAFEMVKVAMEMTRPGDVLVINARGNLGHALLGGNVSRGLKARGLAGVVVDGAVRDIEEIRTDGLPVFARGLSIIMVPIEGAGEVNVPIACGGVVVNPGDLICADEDGVIVVPPHVVEEVAEKAHRLHAGHMAVQEVLLRGEVTNIAAILDRAAQRGGTFIDGAFGGPGGRRG
jgi:regulator of RNase E activity RraA